jgi:hypothetical protein
MSDVKLKVDFINMMEALLEDDATELSIFKLQYILCIIKRIRKVLGKYFTHPDNA